MRSTVFVMLFLALAGTVFARSLEWEMSNTVMTINPDPIKFPVSTYDDYMKDIASLGEPYSVEVSRMINAERNRGYFLIVVRNTIYTPLMSSLATYQNDLYDEGLSSIIVIYSGSSSSDLKNTILSYYNSHGILGVIMVGNLPVAWYEYQTNDNEGNPTEYWDSFPCDLYYADMDGLWIDSDNNGMYDQHTNGTHPEIWISRIRADNLPTIGQTEVNIITSYFARNHLHRTNSLMSTNQALVYVDDDWEGAGVFYLDAMNNLYQNTTLVNTSAETNAVDYRENRLPGSYEFIQVMVHSGPQHHNFKVVEDGNETFGQVLSSELPNLPNSKFFNLYACSNSRYTETNCMGSVYLLGNNYTLNVVGTTKTGSMLYFSEFYSPLSQGMSFGEAYKNWWAAVIDNNQANYGQIHWFYGNVLLGDCTLKVNYNADFVEWTGAASTDWNNPSNWSSNAVPTSTTDIFIQGGLTNYPATSSTAGSCRNILVTEGASISIYNTLTVHGNLSNWGYINLMNSTSILRVYESVVIGDGGTVHSNYPSTLFYIHKDLNILNQANFVYSGYLVFDGSSHSTMTNRSSTTQLGRINFQKTSPAAIICSSSSSADFTIQTNIYVNSNSTFTNNYSGNIKLNGDLTSTNTSGYGINFNAGTLILNGTSHTINIASPNHRINNLMLQAGGSLSFDYPLHVYGNYEASTGAGTIINASSLTVDQNCTLGGNLTLNSSSGDLIVGGNLVWADQSSATINDASADIKCYGDMTFSSSSNVVMSQGYVEFLGTGTANLVNHSSNTVIYHLKANKPSPSYLNFAAASTQGFTIAGNIWNYGGCKLSCGFSGIITLMGNFTSYNAVSQGINILSGTLILNGNNQSINFAYIQDTINNLTANSSGQISILSDLIINGNLIVQSGQLNTGANTITLYGNATVQSALQMTNSSSIFNCHGNLTLSASSNSQFMNGDLNLYSSLFITDGAAANFETGFQIKFRGTSVQSLICEPTGITFADVYVDNPTNHLQLSGATNHFDFSGTLTIVNPSVVRIQDGITVNGGAAVMTGTLQINNGGTLNLADLSLTYAPGYGGGNLNVGENGVLNISNSINKENSTLLNLNGGEINLNMPDTGSHINLYGSTNISDGVLRLVSNGLQLNYQSSFTQTGGSVRLGRGFSADWANVFQPQGGSFVFTGMSSSSIGLSAGCHFHDLVINKSLTTNSISTSTDITVQNDLIMQSGAFVPSASFTCTVNRDVVINGGRLNAGGTDLLLRVGRNWQNTAGQANFIEGSGIVEFFGTQPSILSNENFHALHISKENSASSNAVIPAGATVVASNLVQVLSGCLEIAGGGTLDANDDIIIEIGGGINLAPASNTSILRLAGNFNDYNTEVTTTAGLYSNANSMIVLDGTEEQSISSDADYFQAGTLQINKTTGLVQIWDSLLCEGDLVLLQGTLSFPVTGTHIDVYGSFAAFPGTIMNSGDDIIKFLGNNDAGINSAINLSCEELYVSKSASAGVELLNDLTLTGLDTMFITGGEFRLNSRTFNPGCDITVTGLASLVLTAGSTLNMSSSKTVSVSSRNLQAQLVALGTSEAPALLTCPDGYFDLNIGLNGHVKARHAIFEKLGTYGLSLSARATLDTTDPLANCTFRNGITGGSLISSIAIANMTIPDATFENSIPATSLYNVYKTSGGDLNLINAAGNFSGEAFVFDPDNLVNWQTSGQPPAPQNFTIQRFQNSVRLSWDPSLGAGLYHIYRSLDPYAGWTLQETTSATAWTDPAPVAAERAFYRITAE